MTEIINYIYKRKAHNNIAKFNSVFSTTIDSIVIESIGENEESIIEFEIKL
mgnify:FL=1